MSKTTNSSKLTILPSIKKNTEKHSDVFNTELKYTTILTEPTPQRKKTLQPVVRRYPSKRWCEEGILENGEAYNANIHNLGSNAYQRCNDFEIYKGKYQDDPILIKKDDPILIKSGGKKRTRRHRKNKNKNKNKKTRKQRRRSLRRR